MTKKTALILIMAFASLALCFAGGSTEQKAPDTNTPQTDITESTGKAGNALVVYFSRTGEQYRVGVIDKGSTEIVAEMVAQQTGADIFEIRPANDTYPKTYNALTDVAMQEQRSNARPAYAGDLPNLALYDTVFIGAPVWWGDWPMIMYTFFENCKETLAGKTLIPFSTHEGSGLAGFDKKLAAVCTQSTVGKGLAVRGSDAQNSRSTVRNTVNNWLSELGY